LPGDRGHFALSEGSRYGIVLLLLLSAVTAAIVWPPGKLSSVLTTAFIGASVVAAIVSRSRVLLAVLALGVVVVSIAAAGLAIGSEDKGGHYFLNAVVAGTLPVVFVVRFRRVLYVNVQTVLGAVCIYIVIGIFFASLDAGLSQLSGRSFFSQASDGTSSDFMYYSFITLTTVGYGDLTPTLRAGRALGVTEALIGQLYLVTVIALLVSNFGRSRR
jgi:hypothetical protein